MKIFQLQDVIDREHMSSLTKAPSRSRGGNDGGSRNNPKGFVVSDAPWEQSAPDFSSTDDFPTFGATAPKSSSNAWGPGPRRAGKR